MHTMIEAAPTVREASPQQVSQWLQNDQAVLIDVREPDEHAREHIAGSTLLPLSKFEATRLAGLVGPARRLVLHCRGGRRSADACRLAASLAASGLEIYSLAGGIEGWKREGLPTEVDTRVAGISVMRQVQLVIGLAVLAGSALAWFVDPRFVAIPAFFGAGLTFAGASGTCALATLIGAMPWNRAACGKTCSTGTCG